MTTTTMQHTTDTATFDEAYRAMESGIAARIARASEPLFTTIIDPDALWGRYLNGVPAGSMAHYSCNACRHFLQRYGGLVTISEAGITAPFLWTGLDVPAAIRPVVEGLHALVAGARVRGAYRWSLPVWGIPSNVSAKTGERWTHLHGVPPIRHERAGSTATQQMAALHEDVGILNRSLEDYSVAAVEEAVRVLRSGALTRSEKAEGIAVWFLALHRAIAAAPRARHNLVWRAVASAPPGFAHVRTTVVSTLLDDIVAGKPFEEVSRRWAEKLHPLQYQRPQAPARAGQIDAAERKVKEFGIERSLARRFATLDDVLVKLWTPTAVRENTSPAAGVFGALRAATERVQPLQLPTLTRSWRAFAETVLPDVLALEIDVPSSGGFYGLTTAADADAPPILQWDGLAAHARNPVAWYFYNGGSRAVRWGLVTGWAPVTAVFLSPFQWQDPSRFAHHAPNVHFAIAHARDADSRSLALFPETLRADLREIRAVVEHYSAITQLSGGEQANANGLALGRGERTAVRIRVTTDAGCATYHIDRWE